jgi:predicted DsbA family dithiol-disulfide isomerase
VILAAWPLAAADLNALKSYATKALPRCAGNSITVEPVTQAGPAGFEVFRVTQKSTDEMCGGQKYLLYSPKTDQILLGAVIALPNDSRSAELRLTEQITKILKTTVTVTISPFPLPDGLRAVRLARQTDYGPFAYNGLLDASERFLIVAPRGNLKEDPGKTLRDAIGAASAVRRGNKAAKLEIIEISDFQCPTCAYAHGQLEPLLTKNLDKINYARLDLPLFEHHEWAINAAVGARSIEKVAPSKYWAYVDHVFKNQEKLSGVDFAVFLKNFADDNDINWSAVETIYRSGTERTSVLEQDSRLFAASINSTPTFIINGQVVGFNDGKFVTEMIKKELGVK